MSPAVENVCDETTRLGLQLGGADAECLTARRRPAIALVNRDLAVQNRLLRHREERCENSQVELPDSRAACSNRDREYGRHVAVRAQVQGSGTRERRGSRGGIDT